MKAYLRPTATTLALAAEHMLASSPGKTNEKSTTAPQLSVEEDLNTNPIWDNME